LADDNTAILIKHRVLSKLHLQNHLTSECLKEQLLILNSYYPLHKFSNGKCVFPFTCSLSYNTDTLVLGWFVRYTFNMEKIHILE